MNKEDKINAIKRMFLHSSNLIGVEPISETDLDIENDLNGYSHCTGCAQWFHNVDIMCVDDVGEHFCLACLYSIACLYFASETKQ